MKFWKVFGGILIALTGTIGSVFSQEYEVVNSSYGTQRWVYKIPAAMSRNQAYTQAGFLEKNVAYDTLDIDEGVSTYLEQLPYGHYVFVTVYRNELFFDYYQHSPYYISKIKDGSILRFKVFNDQNEEMKRLAAVQGRQIVFYNHEEACYRFRKDLRASAFGIVGPSDTFYYERTGSYDYNRKFKRKPEKEFKGIVLVNKPKYRHGDTLKMAAYLKKKNGAPYTKEVSLILADHIDYILGEGNVLQKLSPQKPGLYMFEMVVSDTLQLDRSYSLTVQTDKGRRISRRFYLEDYRLDESTITVNVKEANIEVGDSIHIEIQSTDANGLGLRGASAKLELGIYDAGHIAESATYLPIHFFSHEVALHSSGTTSYSIPAEKLPQGTLQFKLDAVITNASNETSSQTRYITISEKQEEAPVTDLYKVEDKTQYLELKAKVPAFGGKKCFAYWVSTSGDTLHSEESSTSGKFHWVPNAHHVYFRFLNPIVYKGVTYKETRIDLTTLPARVFLNVDRNDSLCQFHLVNNRGLKTHFQLYEGGKEIESGYTTGDEDWEIRSKDRFNLTLRVSYEWAGNTSYRTETGSLNTQRIHVVVQAPEQSFPGQKETISVSTKDYHGAPIEGADVIGYGVNSNFRSDPPAQFDYTSKYKDIHLANTYIREVSESTRSRGMHREDAKLLGLLDSQLFYQWIYADSGYQVHDHLPTEYTSFRVHAFDNGKPLAIRIVYVDSVPVYISGASTQPNILCNADTHTVKIRLLEYEVSLKNVVFTDGKSNHLVLDVSQPSSDMQVVKKRKKLSGTERLTLRQYLLKAHSFNPAILQNDENEWFLDRERWRWVGPVAKGTEVQLLDDEGGKKSILFADNTGEDTLFYLRNFRLRKRDLLIGNSSRSQIDPAVFFTDKVSPSDAFLPPEKVRGLAEAPNYKSAIAPNGGTLLIELPEDQIWQWELLSASKVYRETGATSSPIYVGLFTTIRPGEYLFKASSNLEKREYFIEIKADSLLYINEKNEKEFLQLQEPIESAPLSISGKTLDLKSGTYKRNTVSFLKETDPLFGRSSVSSSFSGSFQITGLNPGIYWMYYSGNCVKAIDITDGSVSNIQIVTRSALPGYSTLRNTGGHGFVSYGWDYRSSERSYSPSLHPRSVLFKDDAGTYYGKIRIPGRGSLITGSSNLFGIKGDALLEDVEVGNVSIPADSTSVDQFVSGIYGVTLDGTASFIRSDFSDEAFWEPNLRTDAQGQLSFTAQLPDDITLWNTYFYVFGPKNSTGFAQANIKSSLPMSANLRTPRFLIEGDQADVSLQTLNYTGAPLALTEKLLVNGQSILDRKATVNEDLASQQGIKSEAAGEDLKISYLVASDNGFKDGEERSVPVYQKGLEEHIGHFKQVTEPGSFELTFDPKLGDISVYVAPNPLPGLIRSLDGLKKYPHSCNEQLASKLMAFLIDEAIPGSENSNGNHSAQIKRIIRKLEKNQNSFGAWTWFGKEGSTSDWVTLHVIKALYKAREIGYSVNIAPLQVEHFVKRQTTDINKLRWLQAGRKDLNPALVEGYLKVINYNKLTAYGKLLYLDLTNTFLNEDISARLSALQKRTATGMLYFGSERERFYENHLASTCLGFDLLLKTDQKDELEKVASYLLYSRRNGDWSNTLQKALILERLIPYYELGAKELSSPSSLWIETSNGPVKIKQSMSLPAQEVLRFTKKGSTPLFVTAYQRSFNASPNAKEALAQVSVRLMEDDKTVEQLQAGEPAQLKCQLVVKVQMEYCTLTLPIAAGCDYGSKTSGMYNSLLREVHREYFRDHVVIYFERIAPGSYTLAVNLEPRYSGQYHMNPSQLQLMYFPTLSANNTLQRITIKP